MKNQIKHIKVTNIFHNASPMLHVVEIFGELHDK